jgi:hypothetical protein
VSDRRRTAVLTGIAAGAVLGGALLVPAGPAQAAASAAGSLTLSVRSSDARATVTLRCVPTRGTHPHGGEACTAVAEAHGDLGALKPREGVMCTAIYAPVTATARGSWQGKAVRYKRSFSNACNLHIATGVVFEF